MRPLIVAEPMLRAPRPEMVAELKGTSSPQQEIMQRRRNKSDAKTLRTPKALRAKCRGTSVPFCESSRQDESARPVDFRGAHTLSRRFW
jgi:hypothetical protein